ARAAGIIRYSGGKFFPRGHGHVEPAIMELRSACDTRGEMRFGGSGPNLFSRLRIHGVDVSLHVSKIYGVLRCDLSFDRANADGVAHRAFGLIRPMYASGTFIERVDVADVGTHKHAAGCDR